MQQLRTWQRRATEVIRSLLATKVDRALIAACPGSGKTLFTATILAEWLQAGTIQFATIVVPSRALKSQWKRALKDAGIKSIDDIDNGTLEDHHARGLDLFDPARPVQIVTYQQVTAFPELFAAQNARHRVCVVFDEIHHAAEPADFGQAMVTAFEDAVFKLSLSGTPFNTKGTRLAFCESRTVITPAGQRINETKTDFSYSYGEALQATGADDDPNVVRPVTFIKWNGYARWRLQNVSSQAVTERVIDGSHKADSLTPLLDPTLDNMKKMVRAALEELEDVRRHHTNAGMLITTIDGDHCEQITQLIRNCGVGDVISVMYDTPGAHKLIQEFDRGRQRVLVAVKMISEGVDIKRLRVGVYASNVLTPMFFRQFIGRFIRFDSSLSDAQFASVFIPEHVVLIEYAREIERMVAEAIMPDEGGGDGPPASSANVLLEKQADGAMHGAIQHGMLFAADQTQILKEWMRRAGVVLSITQAEKLWNTVNGQAPRSTAPVEDDEPDESRRNDKLVGRIVAVAKGLGRADVTYEGIQLLANRHVGIVKKDKLTPTALLIRRRQFLEQFLAALYRGDADVAIG